MAKKTKPAKRASKKPVPPLARRGSAAAMSASVPSLLKQAGLR